MAQRHLLSNHGRVLMFIAADPDARLRDIALGVGITERSAHRIVSELVEGGYLTRERTGSRNSYGIKGEVELHDPLLDGHRLGDIVAAVARRPD